MVKKEITMARWNLHASKAIFVADYDFPECSNGGGGGGGRAAAFSPSL